jgi:hypothetical protein
LESPTAFSPARWMTAVTSQVRRIPKMASSFRMSASRKTSERPQMYSFKSGFAAVGKIIDCDDVESGVQQRDTDMGPDVASASGQTRSCRTLSVLAQPLRIAAALPASGAGVAFAGDVVRLLQSLPDGGSLSIHLAPRAGTTLAGMFFWLGWRRCVPRWPQRANGHIRSRNPTTDAVR